MKRAPATLAVAVLLAVPAAATAKTHMFTASISGTGTETYTSTDDQAYMYDSSCTGTYVEQRNDKLTADFKTTKPVDAFPLATNAKSLSTGTYEVFSNGTGGSTGSIVSSLAPKSGYTAEDCPVSSTGSQSCALENSKFSFGVSSDTRGVLSFANSNDTDVWHRADSVDAECRAEQDTGLFMLIPTVTKGTVAKVRKLKKHKSATFKGTYSVTKPYTIDSGNGSAQTSLQVTYKLTFKRTK
jgi:hypothetical protein